MSLMFVFSLHRVLDIDASQRVSLKQEKSNKELRARVPYHQLQPYLHSKLHDSARFVSLIQCDTA